MRGSLKTCKAFSFRIKLGTACRNLCGCQSKPKSRCHLGISVRRPDGLASRGQTRSASQIAFAQVGVMDAPDSAGISCKLREQRCELPQAAPSKVSRSHLFLWRSRTLLKVAIFDFWKLSGVSFELSLYLVAESCECRSGLFVVNYPPPDEITAQFRQNERQIFREAFALARRQRFYCRFDFRNCAHSALVMRNLAPSSLTLMINLIGG